MTDPRAHSIAIAERTDSRGNCGNDIVISAPNRIARTIPSVPIVVIPVFAGFKRFFDIVDPTDCARASDEASGEQRERHQ